MSNLNPDFGTIIFELVQLPFSDKPTEVYKVSDDNFQLSIVLHPNLSFETIYKHVDTGHIIQRYHPLILENEATVIKIGIRYDKSDGTDLFINGSIIDILNEKSPYPVYIKYIKNNKILPHFSIIFDAEKITDDEMHFLQTLNELASRAYSNLDYDLKKSFGLVRSLIIDSPSLIDIANQKHKLKIKFEVAKNESNTINVDPQHEFKSPYPNSNMDNLIISRDKFLMLEVVKIDNYNYSIKDIIHIIANTMGGVHYENQTQDKKRIAFENLSKQLTDMHGRIVFRLIRDICFCIISACEPLAIKIADNSLNQKII